MFEMHRLIWLGIVLASVFNILILVFLIAGITIVFGMGFQQKNLRNAGDFTQALT